MCVRRAIGLAALVVLAGAVRPAAAQQATTTGAVRGVVSGPDGAPLSGATVIAINVETGVRRPALTDDAGRYQIPFLGPGPYTVRAQFIGYRAVERSGFRISIAQVERVDFRLDQSAVTLEAQTITASADVPIIETTKNSSSTRVSEAQIRELPVNGRNFKDLVVLAPGTASDVASGSGGSQSVGGGRAGATNVLIDGVNNNESFFGGDARGGDRAPFSYSIEAVKEIQVITAAYDVERGQFTGGTVNAVTKSGTNRFSGSLFGYFRQDSLAGLAVTGRDFTGRPATNFRSQQYGFSAGGPIVKDKAHFFVSYDRQVRDEPRLIFSSAATGDEFTRAAGVNKDTLANFFNILNNVYGYDATRETGNVVNATNENAVFARLDWQINDKHHLTLRDNFTDVVAENDRVTVSQTTTELASNGGPNKDRGNSLVASLTSLLGGGLTNEFRAQYATEKKPRPSNPSGQFGVALPQVTVNNVRSILSDGSSFNTTIRFGADPVLHNNLLDQQTLELIDNLRWTRGSHTVKFGGSLVRVHEFNRFWLNSLGSFTFNGTSEFESQLSSSTSAFTRNLPYPGKSAIETQDFVAWESALYAQDEWQVNPRIFLTYGLRYDYNWFANKSDPNPDLARLFPQYNTAFQPRDKNNVSPRVGFTFDPNADGRQIIRGGTGIFFGRSPYVLYSNGLATTGRTQTSLTCGTVSAPTPDFQSYADDPSTIPTACVGAAATPPTPDINVFEDDFKQSYAWKANLAYDRLIVDGWRLTLEGIYSTTRDNYVLVDENLNPVPRFLADGGIPIFVDPATISTANGAVSVNNSRRSTQINRLFVTRSVGSSLGGQGIVQLDGRTKWGGIYATYTLDNTRDNFSRSCCTLGDYWGDTRANGNPNNYDDQWGPAAFNRRHSFVFSPRFNLPYGFQLSAIARLFSGRPYTPVYQFDINGDGQSNDRAYVPTLAQLNDGSYLIAGATTAEQARQRSLLEQVIERNECLQDQRGRVATRNSCRNPWQKVVDVRFSKRFPTVNGQSVELQADAFNLLNGLNRKWGQRKEVQFAGAQFLVPAGFDPAQRKFRYRVNEQFGQATTANIFTSQQFQMQLGLRYNF
ncbi:MAG: carboxypeptidase regulatory-like domain-containing protein [Gemmatimonadaceae bacterium]